MARCDDIKLLLGPFEDGELEPHEMQEVARHVVACAACDGELADYRALGLAMRDGAELPDLTGFAAAVLELVDDLPIALGTRVRRFFNSFAGGIGGTLATAMATAAIAVITAVVLTPYARQFTFGGGFANPPQAATRVAADLAPAAPFALASVAAPQAATVASGERRVRLPPAGDANALPAASAIDLASQQNSADDAADTALADSTAGHGPSTVISRLEASSPSVAVWSEPQTDTTVIWVPDQQP
ncbi:MAG TPA: zf-HC2 domain-containing protein [Candidatus Binataceae bacterium]|nr:zf-HC2 domain-containing protein [Candidatus Binataceae bacterium]